MHDQRLPHNFHEGMVEHHDTDASAYVQRSQEVSKLRRRIRTREQIGRYRDLLLKSLHASSDAHGHRQPNRQARAEASERKRRDSPKVRLVRCNYH